MARYQLQSRLNNPLQLQETIAGEKNMRFKFNRELTILERRVRWSAMMISFALIATMISLLVFHPLSFIGYAFFGVAIMLLGNVYFLYAIVRGNRIHTPSGLKQ
jgi:hypothetical protein